MRRGWANDLFTSEDKILLQQALAQTKAKRARGYRRRLNDGTDVYEINNKFVIEGGTFNKPIIYNILAISADNEEEATEIKRKFYVNGWYKNYDRQNISSWLEFVRLCYTNRVEVFNREDYVDVTAGGTTRARATLPNDFKNFGYTQKQQNGSGVSSEDGRDERYRYSLDVDTVTEERARQEKHRLPSDDAQAIGVMTAEMDELARNSGRIPQGERVKRDIAVPRKVNGEKTMRWARTFFESGVGTPEMVDPVAEGILEQIQAVIDYISE